MKPTTTEIQKVKHDVAELTARKDRIAQDVSDLLDSNAVIDTDLNAAKNILKALEMLEKHCGLDETKVK